MPVPDRVRVFYDAEFTGLHRNTTLISIGFWCPDLGAYFYAEFTDYDQSQVSDWIQDNVISNLTLGSFDVNEYRFYKDEPANRIAPSVEVKGNSATIKEQLLNWLKILRDISGKTIQFYTDCYAYDWITLMDLICDGGDNMNLPDYIDYIPIDLSTMLLMKGIDPDITREEFADQHYLNMLPNTKPFSDWSRTAIKHNSLWDACVAYLCYFNIEAGTKSKGEE